MDTTNAQREWRGRREIPGLLCCFFPPVVELYVSYSVVSRPVSLPSFLVKVEGAALRVGPTRGAEDPQEVDHDEAAQPVGSGLVDAISVDKAEVYEIHEQGLRTETSGLRYRPNVVHRARNKRKNRVMYNVVLTLTVCYRGAFLMGTAVFHPEMLYAVGVWRLNPPHPPIHKLCREQLLIKTRLLQASGARALVASPYDGKYTHNRARK